MTDLQNGDRLYYLARTPGMNLRTQLEGNSFSEMIMRNTDGTNTLKADVFATADCKFQLGNLAGTAGRATPPPAVRRSPTTRPRPTATRTLLLLRKPDGTIQYQEKNTVDPSGINGQSVYNGTASVDRVTRRQRQRHLLGQRRQRRHRGWRRRRRGPRRRRRRPASPTSPAPTCLKGGPGNDYINTGIGNDIMMGGDGQDFTNGGANDNETFAGPGNDFMQAGDGADAVFGDGGDDWIQGGSGQDLLIGDHGAPFFDDPAQTKPGNDIFVGQVGENDYDAEGGDDIMAANAAIDRFAGAAGFDWAIHQYDTVGADDDMNDQPQPGRRCRCRSWSTATAGRRRRPARAPRSNDVIRGDDVVPSTVGGAGFSGCDVLDQDGIDRIAGLGDILPDPEHPARPRSRRRRHRAPARSTGPVWGDGNILLGGLGSDTPRGPRRRRHPRR